MIAGVCGGLAEYSGIDVVLWRVGFLVFALMGAGVLVYPLLWIVMPSGNPGSGGPLDRVADRLHERLRGDRPAPPRY